MNVDLSQEKIFWDDNNDRNDDILTDLCGLINIESEYINLLEQQA